VPAQSTACGSSAPCHLRLEFDLQVGFVREYWTDVFEPMLDLYMSGI
jgi:hypothetical protein